MRASSSSSQSLLDVAYKVSVDNLDLARSSAVTTSDPGDGITPARSDQTHSCLNLTASPASTRPEPEMMSCNASQSETGRTSKVSVDDVVLAHESPRTTSERGHRGKTDSCLKGVASATSTIPSLESMSCNVSQSEAGGTYKVPIDNLRSPATTSECGHRGRTDSCLNGMTSPTSTLPSLEMMSCSASQSEAGGTFNVSVDDVVLSHKSPATASERGGHIAPARDRTEGCLNPAAPSSSALPGPDVTSHEGTGTEQASSGVQTIDSSDGCPSPLPRSGSAHCGPEGESHGGVSEVSSCGTQTDRSSETAPREQGGFLSGFVCKMCRIRTKMVDREKADLKSMRHAPHNQMLEQTEPLKGKESSGYGLNQNQMPAERELFEGKEGSGRGHYGQTQIPQQTDHFKGNQSSGHGHSAREWHDEMAAAETQDPSDSSEEGRLDSCCVHPALPSSHSLLPPQRTEPAERGDNPRHRERGRALVETRRPDHGCECDSTRPTPQKNLTPEQAAPFQGKTINISGRGHSDRESRRDEMPAAGTAAEDPRHLSRLESSLDADRPRSLIRFSPDPVERGTDPRCASERREIHVEIIQTEEGPGCSAKKRRQLDEQQSPRRERELPSSPQAASLVDQPERREGADCAARDPSLLVTLELPQRAAAALAEGRRALHAHGGLFPAHAETEVMAVDRVEFQETRSNLFVQQPQRVSVVVVEPDGGGGGGGVHGSRGAVSFRSLEPEVGGFATEGNEVTGTPVSHLTGPSGSRVSHFTDLADSNMSHLTDPAGSQASHLTDFTSFQVSHLTDPTGSHMSHLTDLTGLQVSHLTEPTGFQVSRLTEPTGSCVSQFTDLTGFQVSHLTDQTGFQVSHLTDQTGFQVSRLTDQPGFQVSHLTDQPGFQVSHLTDQTGFQVSYLAALPSAPDEERGGVSHQYDHVTGTVTMMPAEEEEEEEMTLLMTAADTTSGEAAAAAAATDALSCVLRWMEEAQGARELLRLQRMAEATLEPFSPDVQMDGNNSPAVGDDDAGSDASRLHSRPQHTGKTTREPLSSDVQMNSSSRTIVETKRYPLSSGVQMHKSSRTIVETTEPLSGVQMHSSSRTIVETTEPLSGVQMHSSRTIVETTEPLSGVQMHSSSTVVETKRYPLSGVQMNKSSRTIVETTEPLSSDVHMDSSNNSAVVDDDDASDGDSGGNDDDASGDGDSSSGGEGEASSGRRQQDERACRLDFVLAVLDFLARSLELAPSSPSALGALTELLLLALGAAEGSADLEPAWAEWVGGGPRRASEAEWVGGPRRASEAEWVGGPRGASEAEWVGGSRRASEAGAAASGSGSGTASMSPLKFSALATFGKWLGEEFHRFEPAISQRVTEFKVTPFFFFFFFLFLRTSR